MRVLPDYLLTVLAVAYANLLVSTVQATSLTISSKQSSQTSKSLLKILTSSTPLQVRIKDGYVRTATINSGPQIFEADHVADSDSPNAKISYSWSSVMYNGAGENIGTCITSGTPTTDRKLTIDPAHLTVSVTCVINLTVTSSSGKSGFVSLNLKITPENSPKCIAETERPVVKPGDRTKLTVTCTSGSKIKNTVWKSLTDEDATFLDLNNAIEDTYIDALLNNVYRSVIVLRKGVLKAGSKYNLEATVTDETGAQTKKRVTVTVMEMISGGKISCPNSYVELDPMRISMGKMNELSSVTFTLLVQTSPGKYKTLAHKQKTGNFSTIGPHAYGAGNNVFVAESCAEGQNDLCEMTSCIVPRVFPTSDVNTVANKLKEQVDDLRQQGRSLEAAVLLSTLYEKTKDKSLISQLLNTAREAFEKKIRNDNSVGTVLDMLVNIPPAQLSQEQVTALTNFMTTATDFFITKNMKMPERFVSALDLWVVRAEAAGLSDKDVRAVAQKAVMVESAGLEYGNSNTHDLESSRVTSFNDIPGNYVKCKDGNDNDIHISFGPSVREKVGHKNLKFKVRAYKTRPKHTLETKTSTVAPIIDMSFFDPKTHAEEHVSDLRKPTSIYFTLNKDHVGSQVPVECVYWCPTRQAWVTDGVATGVHTSTTVECKTSHFSTYTVVHAHQPYNRDHKTGWIVGTVLALIIAMIIIILLLVYLVYRAKRRQVNDSSRPHSRLAESPTDDDRKRDDNRDDRKDDNRRGNSRRDSRRDDDRREDERHELTRYDSPRGQDNRTMYEVRPGSGDGLKRGVY